MVTTASSKGNSGSGKVKDVESCLYPATCGFTISGRDPHPLCIACMGGENAQALLADSESCDHSCAMLVKPREKPAAASTDWGEGMGDPDTQFPPLFSKLLDSEDGDDDEDEVDPLLGDENEVDDEDAILPPAQLRPSSSIVREAQPSPAPCEVDLHKVCKRAATRLAVDWPASLDAIPVCMKKMNSQGCLSNPWNVLN